jgi:hypothetical protein
MKTEISNLNINKIYACFIKLRAKIHKSVIMQTAKFTVLTHSCVQKSNNTGYSWGLLVVESKNLIHLSEPCKRGRIIALQQIPGKMLDTFSFYRTRTIQPDDLSFMDKLKTWTITVNIPDTFFEKDTFSRWAADDISMWLRCDMSGADGDKTVYEIPDNLGEHDLDESMIVV